MIRKVCMQSSDIIAKNNKFYELKKISEIL